MPLELFKNIIDQSSDFVEFVDFTLRGEPLLNPDIFSMISYARSKDIFTGLQTNGLLLTNNNCESLFQAGLNYLVISIDAATAKTYDQIRKPGFFDEVVKNTKNLIEVNCKQEKPLTIIVQMINMPENREEIKIFKENWKDFRNVIVRTKPVSSRAGLIKTASKRTPFHYNRCSRVWKSMFILSDGTVIPCCNDFQIRRPLGNLNSQLVKEVWNSPSFIELRDQLCAGNYTDIGLCRDCEVPEICFYKHAGTFLFDDLVLRKLLAKFDFKY